MVFSGKIPHSLLLEETSWSSIEYLMGFYWRRLHGHLLKKTLNVAIEKDLEVFY